MRLLGRLLARLGFEVTLKIDGRTVLDARRKC